MLDLLESYLARWTGRADWPATTATLDAQLKVGGGAPTFEGSDVDTSDVRRLGSGHVQIPLNLVRPAAR